MLKFINDRYANPAGGAVCAQGHSGGASAIGYAMEFYGADRAASTVNGDGYLDTVVMTSGPTLADIRNGCHFDQASQPPVTSVCQGGVCVGQAAAWESCLRYPMGGQADCFGDNQTYPTGGHYDTAQAVALHTVGFYNPNRPHGNCNNWTTSGNDTNAIDPDWQAMSLVPVPLGEYPETFVYGFLCQGPHTDPLDPNLDISNNSAAQGWSYLGDISVSSGQPNGLPRIYRVNGCADPEMIWKPTSVAVGTIGPQSGYQASEQAMENNCAGH